MLFDPITIRETTIKNRVVVPPMVITKSDENGHVTDFERQHYRKFAEGGAGLIIQEATCINDTGKLCDTQLGVWNDGQIEELRSIVEIAHKNGAAIVLQIHHAGVKSTGSKLDVPFDFDIECTAGAFAEKQCLWKPPGGSARNSSKRDGRHMRQGTTA